MFGPFTAKSYFTCVPLEGSTITELLLLLAITALRFLYFNTLTPPFPWERASKRPACATGIM